jgi:hypothetical protein
MGRARFTGSSRTLNSTYLAILKLDTLMKLIHPAIVFEKVSNKELSADPFWKTGLAAAIIYLVDAHLKP